jgi:NADPH-dependent 2,4-dienoyl-CoA reductase/sulfur reductase-like enzyme
MTEAAADGPARGDNDGVTVRLVVIGADAAGMAAAAQARARRRPDELRIIAFDRGHFTSYSACGIPYWVSGLVSDRDDLIARTAQVHRDDYGIDIRLRHEVVGIDLDRRVVTAHSLDDGGREVVEPFDTLVYAAGAVPVRPDWADADVEGVFGIQTLDDGNALRAWLERDPRPCRSVVVGAGYVGVEMAEALMRRGLDVTLVEKSGQPMSTVDPDMGARIRDQMVGVGMHVRTGVSVQALEADEGAVRAVLTEAGRIPVDVVVLGFGVRPNTELARAAGFPLGDQGGILTDAHMRVLGHESLFAVGDCVQVTHRISNASVYIPLGTHANKQGRVAGVNIGGGDATFPGVVGTAVTNVCGFEVARTGLGEVQARRAGFDTVVTTIESTSRATYFPDTKPVTVKLIAQRGTGRLLGGQIVGWSEAAKRIDPVAVAVWNGMTVDELTMLDLGYAPPYAPVWDPILVAGRKLAHLI